MINVLFEYQFMQNALIASFFASIVCGIIGVIIVEKKLTMMSGGIAHISYGGVGLGYLLGFEPIMGAFLFSVIAALGIGFIKRKRQSDSDIIIGLLWSLGMALGILFVALRPGYPPDLSSYLFGNILSVTKNDLYLMAGLTFTVLIVIFTFFNNWKAYLFDDEFASIIGLRTKHLEYLILVLIAMTVVVLIRVVGIILVISMLTAPAATAGMFTYNLKRRMFYAFLFGIFFCFTGLWVSYELNIASGAVIVILSAVVYFGVYLTKALISKLKNKKDRLAENV